MFFPEIPREFYCVSRICRLLKIEMIGYSSSINPPLVIAFEDSTESNLDVNEYIKRTHRVDFTADILNVDCTNISKSYVGEIFKTVFNYSLNVDPTEFTGEVVKKSDINGLHDGQIISCPVEESKVDKEASYTVLVDNTITEDDNTVEDLRVSIMGGQIPLVYQKRRNISNRFANVNESIIIGNKDRLFSKEEQSNILEFSDRMGLNLGELDILRDKKTKRIYIVDVNKTMTGPPPQLTRKDFLRALLILANGFEKNIVTKQNLET